MIKSKKASATKAAPGMVRLEFASLDDLQRCVDALDPAERAQLSAERGEGVEFLYVPDTLVARVDAARPGLEEEPETPAIKLSFLEFMDLFTGDEQLAIAGAAMIDVPTKLWYDRAVGAQFIDLGDARLAAGMQALVDGALLTGARRDRVLTGLHPE